MGARVVNRGRKAFCAALSRRSERVHSQASRASHSGNLRIRSRPVKRPFFLQTQKVTRIWVPRSGASIRGKWCRPIGKWSSGTDRCRARRGCLRLQACAIRASARSETPDRFSASLDRIRAIEPGASTSISLKMEPAPARPSALVRSRPTNCIIRVRQFGGGGGAHRATRPTGVIPATSPAKRLTVFSGIWGVAAGFKFAVQFSQVASKGFVWRDVLRVL